MPISNSGIFSARSTPQILADLQASMREQFGDDVDVTANSVIRKMLEASVALPIAEIDADMAYMFAQMFFATATGTNLDKLIEPFGFQRLPASRASGVVNITLLSAEPAGAWLVPGDVTFVDTLGRRYDLISAVPFNGTTDLEATVLSQELGLSGNIPIGAIARVTINGTPSPTFAATVSSFTNDAPFTGGANTESDTLLRRRVRELLASRETASVGGITAALRNVVGVTGVSIVENSDMIGQQQNKVFDSNETGTPSSVTINSANDRIAQKMVLTQRRWVQHFNAQLDSDTDLVATVTVEADNANEPDGTPIMTLSGFDFDGTNLTAGTFPTGIILEPGTYWLQFEWESGAGVFDGGTGGTADQVRTNTAASWADDGAIENMNAELIGGVPPKAFRAFVTGGLDDAVAQKIFDTKAAGIYSDGLVDGAVEDLSGFAHTVYFERPEVVPIVLSVVVTKSSQFSGDEDTIRDIIMAYIGGTDTEGNANTGLAVEEKAVRNEIISRLLDDDIVNGTVDVTTMRLGLKSAFATPGALTGAEVVNLIPTVGQEFTVEDVDADIAVTLVDD